MTYSTLRQHRLFRPALGSVLAAVSGLLLWVMPLGDAWTQASYDYLFRFGACAATNPVVVVLLDNEAYAELGQNRGQPWDRALHARLFNRLADDGCALVVPDIVFRQAGERSVDQAMAGALHRLPRLVLAAGQAKVAHPGVDSARPTLPLALFLDPAGTNWGVAWLDPDLDNIVRRHWPFPSPGPYQSLPWLAANLMGAPLADRPSERWLRYYDFNKSWVSLSYHLALAQNPGFFRGKIVFIGNKPATPLPNGELDKFQVPQTRWTGESVGGVEILATSFLNLLNGDWLRRLTPAAEGFLLLVFGSLLGGWLPRFQRHQAILAAGLVALLLTGCGIAISGVTNYWFPWLIVVAGQLPCALVWTLASSRVPVPGPVAAPGGTIVLHFPDEASPDAPDYEIFNPPVGQGSYGKVWVVRNAIGQWQALKAIYQSKFGDNTLPYEAEFKGLQKYKPVSEKHPGLLRIELISKMKSEGYFYYVMELGDARVPGWENNPASYQPKDLECLRKQSPGGRLPADECLRILTILADALDFLHQQGLIHRDIKPSNVVFVSNRPKLADIGLVADIQPADRVNTLVGTPGYMPPLPERPGTVQADIYALGMVLYVISTGKMPAFFPEISATMMDRGAGKEGFIRLDPIILKACQPDLSQRYPTTAAMLKDLRAASGK